MSLQIWGHPARIVIQLDIGEGRTVSVPVEADIEHAYDHYGVLRIPLKGEIVDTVHGTLDDVAFKGLNR